MRQFIRFSQLELAQTERFVMTVYYISNSSDNASHTGRGRMQ
jgi:hypothetical protein